MNPIFPKGNIDSWNFAITNYLPKAVNIVMKTVDPVICAALIALVGSTDEFERDSGNYQISYDKDGLPFSLQAVLTYKVPSFKVSQVDDDAVRKDKAFILSYLKQVRGFQLQSLQINTARGEVSVVFSVKIGYSND